MTAIQSARKRILYGNTIWKRPPYQGSAYSFLVLLIRFSEGVRLTHQTSESAEAEIRDGTGKPGLVGETN